jgi:hypothetical protein
MVFYVAIMPNIVSTRYSLLGISVAQNSVSLLETVGLGVPHAVFSIWPSNETVLPLGSLLLLMFVATLTYMKPYN